VPPETKASKTIEFFIKAFCYGLMFWGASKASKEIQPLLKINILVGMLQNYAYSD